MNSVADGTFGPEKRLLDTWFYEPVTPVSEPHAKRPPDAPRSRGVARSRPRRPAARVQDPGVAGARPPMLYRGAVIDATIARVRFPRCGTMPDAAGAVPHPLRSVR